jgi:hypothetical protein
VLAVAVQAGSLAMPRAHALGEVYNFYLSSSRVQESNTPGVKLLLNVTSATVGSPYRFTFTVRDPNGIGKSSINSTTTTSSTFVLSVVYPRDFGVGVNIQYVGNYTINISQNQPTNKASVATGQFQVGLTDAKSYERTHWVSIIASGYGVSENITTSLIHTGIPVSGFPNSLLANASGNLNYSWRVPPNAPLGVSTLTLTGSATTKTPIDTQTLTITSTTINIPGLTVNSPNIPRTVTQQVIFAPKYQDGQRAQTGTATIRIAQSDGVTQVNTTASYDSSTGTFRASYIVPKNAMAGIWIATIDPNKFDDGYGNLGPAVGTSVGFSVQPASLNVSVIPTSSSLKTLGPGDLILVYAAVTFPDGSPMDSGTVVAKLTHAGTLIGTPVILTYISGQQQWAGSYQVANSDPSGLWIITVDASDQLSDSGEGTSSAAVNVPPISTPTAGLSTSTFLLIAAIAAAVALALLFWAFFVARRKVRRTEVKLDLRVVDREVDRIQGSEFFSSVRKQVEDKKPSEPDKSEAGSKGDGGSSDTH